MLNCSADFKKVMIFEKYLIFFIENKIFFYLKPKIMLEIIIKFIY